MLVLVVTGLLVYFRFSQPVAASSQDDPGLDPAIIEEIRSLEATVKAQQERLDTLQETNKRQRSEITALARHLDDSEQLEFTNDPENEKGVDKTLPTEKTQTPLHGTTSLLNQSVQLERRFLLTAPSNATSQPVAFYAKYSSSTQQNVSRDQPISFNDVQLNLLNAFSSATNVFTTPVSGVYLFSVSVEGTANSLAKVALTKNGERVAVAYSDALDYEMTPRTNTYDQGAVTVALSLRKGDAVAVKAFFEPIHTISGGGNTVFGGVLMWKFE